MNQIFQTGSQYSRYVLIGLFAVLSGWLVCRAPACSSWLLLLALPGVLAAGYFFARPEPCYWAIFYGAMLAGIPVSYVPGMYNLRWGVNLLSLLLGATLLSSLALRRGQVRYRSSSVFSLFLLFALYSAMISMVNGVPAKQLLISLKNNFQFLPVLLFFLVYPLPRSFSPRLVKAVWMVALVQPPIALLQYIFVVPRLRSMSMYDTTTLLDSVNGSFGTSLKGGGTGMYTLFTCTILVGLLVTLSKKKLSVSKYSLLSLYMLFPMFLNETKAAFLFLLLGSMVALGIDKKIKMGRKAVLALCAVLLATLMVWFTLQMSARYGKTAGYVWEETFSYTFGQKGYGRYSLNRFTCLTFWWHQNTSSFTNLLVGHGLDATNEGDAGLGSVGSVARRYPLYGTGLTTASKMLWETGLLGFGIFLAVFFVSIKKCITFARSTVLDYQEQHLALILAAGISMTMAFFFYNALYRNSQPANFFITILLGSVILLQHSYTEGVRGDR